MVHREVPITSLVEVLPALPASQCLITKAGGSFAGVDPWGDVKEISRCRSGHHPGVKRKWACMLGVWLTDVDLEPCYLPASLPHFA